jgi:hypothetical protein
MLVRWAAVPVRLTFTAFSCRLSGSRPFVALELCQCVCCIGLVATAGACNCCSCFFLCACTDGGCVGAVCACPSDVAAGGQLLLCQRVQSAAQLQIQQILVGPAALRMSVLHGVWLSMGRVHHFIASLPAQYSTPFCWPVSPANL